MERSSTAKSLVRSAYGVVYFEIRKAKSIQKRMLRWVPTEDDRTRKVEAELCVRLHQQHSEFRTRKKRQPAALQPALRASSESSAARSASSQNAFNGFGRARERTILQSSGKLWRQILGATPNTVRDLRPWSGQGPNTDWAED